MFHVLNSVVIMVNHEWFKLLLVLLVVSVADINPSINPNNVFSLNEGFLNKVVPRIRLLVATQWRNT